MLLMAPDLAAYSNLENGLVYVMVWSQKKGKWIKIIYFFMQTFLNTQYLLWIMSNHIPVAREDLACL